MHVTSFSHKLSLEMNLVKITAPEELKVEILECPLPGLPFDPFILILGNKRRS